MPSTRRMAPMIYASSKCPACGAHDVMSVDMTLVGSALAFSFCTMCEWKGWEREGKVLSLSSVLSLVAAP
jgi:hypothetical protein